MNMWSLTGPVVRVDAWLLLGAVLQCALVLRARRFELLDWIIPLFILIGIAVGWFAFLSLCSNPVSAAPMFDIGFIFAVMGCGFYLADAAPPRLSAPALLSLTMTFWAVYLSRDMSRHWLWAAVPMSLGAVVFAAQPRRTPAIGRMLLQAWSLVAGAVAAFVAIPSHVPAVLFDYRLEDLAASLKAPETLMTGAQVMLFAMLAAGVILVTDQDTRRGWEPSQSDRGPSWSSMIVLAAQGVLVGWALRGGPVLQGQVFGLMVLGGLAHGAMSGGDAGPRVRVPGDGPELDADGEEIPSGTFDPLAEYLRRNRD